MIFEFKIRVVERFVYEVLRCWGWGEVVIRVGGVVVGEGFMWEFGESGVVYVVERMVFRVIFYVFGIGL